MDKITALLPASQIPAGQYVTKKTGGNVYKIEDEINIYGKDNAPKTEVKSDDGCRFLMGTGNSINVINGTTEVLWAVNVDDFLRFIEKQRSHK